MNRQIVLKTKPVGMPGSENFSIIEAPEPVLQQGELLVKTKFISVDPYMRGRMGTSASNLPQFEIGKPLEGAVLAEVIESRDPGFRQGEMVKGTFLWQELQVVKADQATRINTEIPNLSDHLGILGLTGLTAYFGLQDIGKPVEGETVVVSGAAGAVGSVAGQIAKIKGCRVVGIAGSDDKVILLKDELHFDAAFNYHRVGLGNALKVECPHGVDLYFDNVGGEISDMVLQHINKGARIMICGQISQYNNTEPSVGPRIQPLLLTKSALMQGFSARNYALQFDKGLEELTTWLKEGKLISRQTIIKGFENLPMAFIGLFQGKNTGKCLVEIL
jgi:NADPH-dependent curcumin reductase CurA